MASFQYEALKMSDRTKVNGLITATSEKEARELLREQELIPTKLRAISDKLAAGGKSNPLAGLVQMFTGVGAKERIAFTRNIGMMIRSGIPLTEALMYFETYVKNRQFRGIVGRIRSDIMGGMSFSQALARHKKLFNDVYVNVAPYIGRALRENSGLRVFVGQGYYEFLDSVFATGEPSIESAADAIEHGATLVVNSTTKYLTGNGTVTGGVVVDSGQFDWMASDKFPSLTAPNPSYPGAVLTDVLPEGTTFVSASNGGRPLGMSVSMCKPPRSARSRQGRRERATGSRARSRLASSGRRTRSRRLSRSRSSIVLVMRSSWYATMTSTSPASRRTCGARARR